MQANINKTAQGFFDSVLMDACAEVKVRREVQSCDCAYLPQRKDLKAVTKS